MISAERARNYRQGGATRRLQTWRVLVLPVCTLMLSPFLPLSPCPAQQLPSMNSARSAKFSGTTHAANKKSDAEAGVQLLETIISRVMNIPQVALTKSTSQLAQNLKQQNSPTDYKLAIRPKESGKAFAVATKLPLVIAQAGNEFSAPGNLALRQQGLTTLPPTSTSGFVDTSSSDSGVYGDESAPSAGTADSWKGSSLSRIALKNEAGAGGASGASSNNAPGLWEDFNARGLQASSAPSPPSAHSQRSVSLPSVNGSGYMRQPGDNLYSPSNQTAVRGNLRSFLAAQHSGGGLPATNMGKYARPASAEEVRRSVPDLSTSINKLYKVSKGLEDIQNISEKSASPQIASADKQKAQWNSPRDYQLVDDRPIIRDMREAPSANAPYLEQKKDKERAPVGAGVASSVLDADAIDYASNYPAKKTSFQVAAAPSPPSQSRKAKSSRLSKPSASYSERSDRIIAPGEAGKTNIRDRLALLPPNVATGIPGLNLNLGTTELQAVQALAQSGGKLKQQRIRNWSVYSWTKRESDGSDALQLYFRHGLLDAIRIFDSELISTGFGVSPGDQLEVVKERFGEPAFLLPEPDSGARSDTGGKNYIYPISQVGFQLARRGSDSSPQVVSVLIFSVK